MHHTVSLAGELGEVANIVKKIDRGDFTIEQAMDEEFMKSKGYTTLHNEVADVFIYLLNIVGLLDFDLMAEFLKKRDFNIARWESK
jgi:NTP pyrophosphatase (non-canonical NTP hydrolase)